jgi:hypothetical protein
MVGEYAGQDTSMKMGGNLLVSCLVYFLTLKMEAAYS